LTEGLIQKTFSSEFLGVESVNHIKWPYHNVRPPKL